MDPGGTVRGTFDLNTPALEKMSQMRESARLTTTSMRELGNEMDRVGGPLVAERLDSYKRGLREVGSTAEEVRGVVANAWAGQRSDIDREATVIEGRIDRLDERVRRFGRTRATAHVELSGVERANAQLTQLEMRLSRLSHQRSTATVGVGGGFSNLAGGGARALGGGGGGNFLGPIANIPPIALAGAALLPVAQGLAGGATALAGSAGGAALGAGTIALGGYGALAAGGGLSYAIAREGVKNLQAITKEQQKYTQAVQEFGAASTQAVTAKRNLDQAFRNAPGSAAAASGISAFRQAYQTATRPAYSAFYGGVAGVTRAGVRAAPNIGRNATAATAATSSAATAYANFLAGPQSQQTLTDLTGTFVAGMPAIEGSVRNLTSTVEHLAVAARPFFLEGTQWIDHWTHGLAASSSNEARVTSTMHTLVNETRDWGRLGSAAFHTLRDIFQMGAPTGDSMVVSLTHTLDRWDQWLRNNPQRVQGFFTQARNVTDDVARTLLTIVHLLSQTANILSPILQRASGFFNAVGGMGPLGLAGLAVAGSGAYQGLTGGRGPSGAQVILSGITGRPVGGRSWFGGGAGGAAAAGALVGAGATRAMTVARATGAEVAAGRAASGAFLMGPATVGASAVLARRQAAADAALAEQAGGASRLAGVRDILTLGNTRRMLAGGLGDARALMTGDAVARARLMDAGGGVLSAGRMAVGGAARAFLPIAALMTLLQPTTAHGVPGVVSQKAGQFLNMASFGLIPANLPGQALGATPTGLSGAGIHRASASLARQVNAASTQQQFQAIGAQIPAMRMMGGEMSPGQRRQWESYLTGVSRTVASNAGQAAASAWSTAFSAGAQREGPTRAMRDMRMGIGVQLKQLNADGRRQFANAIGAWAGQMETDNPKLRRPVERLMKQVTDSMRQMGQNVTYYNGMILDGSRSQWQQIGKALTDPVMVAQEKLSGTFNAIVGEALRALELMGFSPRNAHQIVGALQQGLSLGQVGQGTFTPQNMAAFSQTQGARHTTRGGRARGGVIGGGGGLLDTVGVGDGGKAAPGEAWIANRHTMNDISRATLEKYGVTAWQMIQRETRMHSEPVIQGGILPGLTRGGRMYQLGGILGAVANSVNAATPARSGGGVLGSIASSVNSAAGGGTGSMAAMVNAANAITSRHFPYLWGGGHDAGFTGPYDCSGAVSAILHAGGLLASPEVSGWFENYGQPGPGAVTLFANPSHVYMALGNRYFGTSSANPGGGAGWFSGSPRPGFTVRHVDAAGGGALGAIGLGGAAAGAGFPPISLHSPGTGAPGVGGVLADRAGAIFAAGLQKRVNDRLRSMSAPNVGMVGTGGASGGTSGQNQTLGRAMMLAAGWGPDQWPALQALWTQESGWDANSVNGSSGAYGIPQALGHGHPFNLGDARGQIAWGLNYIRSRYGSPAAAEAHERANNWYQRGGRASWGGWHAAGGDFITRGPTVFGAGETPGRPERVSVTSAHRGGAASSTVQVNIDKLIMAGTDKGEVERVAREIAEKIMVALQGSGSGVTDRELVR